MSGAPLSTILYPLSSFSMRHGFLLIDKPEGPTSHDSVAAVRKALSERKVGHLGTLDPAATGLLVIAVGTKALKVIELFSDLSKQYVANIAFGSVSATFDREGPIEQVQRKPGVLDPDESAVRIAIADRFLGKVQQVPPAASAVKIGGERAYRKMRQGRAVDMPTREVEIEECDVLSYAYPSLQLRVLCGSGTYIRSLAHDLGDVLHVGGYLAALRRTKVGDWAVDNAVYAEEAKWTNVIPLKEVLKDRPSRELSDVEADHITHGRVIDGEVEPDTIAWHGDLPIAILENIDGGVKARKVF